ncbi:MAG: ABC transporter permease, partial [Clostridium sp.]
MKNVLIKDTFREIKKSFGRFISIMAIVTLGVAFFAGINVASPVMKFTADKYYDDYNFMDIKLVSTLGFDKDDIAEIKKIDSIEGVYETNSLD